MTFVVPLLRQVSSYHSSRWIWRRRRPPTIYIRWAAVSKICEKKRCQWSHVVFNAAARLNELISRNWALIEGWSTAARIPKCSAPSWNCFVTGQCCEGGMNSDWEAVRWCLNQPFYLIKFSMIRTWPGWTAAEFHFPSARSQYDWRSAGLRSSRWRWDCVCEPFTLQDYLPPSFPLHIGFQAMSRQKWALFKLENQNLKAQIRIHLRLHTCASRAAVADDDRLPGNDNSVVSGGIIQNGRQSNVVA